MNQLYRLNFGDIAHGTGFGPGKDISGWDIRTAANEIADSADVLPREYRGLEISHLGLQWSHPDYAVVDDIVEGFASGIMPLDAVGIKSGVRRTDNFPSDLRMAQLAKDYISHFNPSLVYIPDVGPSTDSFGPVICRRLMSDERFRRRLSRVYPGNIVDSHVSDSSLYELWRQDFNRTIHRMWLRGIVHLVQSMGLLRKVSLFTADQPPMISVLCAGVSSGNFDVYDDRGYAWWQTSVPNPSDTTCAWLSMGRYGEHKPIENSMETLTRTYKNTPYVVGVLDTDFVTIDEAIFIAQRARDLDLDHLILHRSSEFVSDHGREIHLAVAKSLLES